MKFYDQFFQNRLNDLAGNDAYYNAIMSDNQNIKKLF
jgi:hypothetical protein